MQPRVRDRCYSELEAASDLETSVAPLGHPRRDRQSSRRAGRRLVRGSVGQRRGSTAKACGSGRDGPVTAHEAGTPLGPVRVGVSESRLGCRRAWWGCPPRLPASSGAVGRLPIATRGAEESGEDLRAGGSYHTHTLPAATSGLSLLAPNAGFQFGGHNPGYRTI